MYKALHIQIMVIWLGPPVQSDLSQYLYYIYLTIYNYKLVMSSYICQTLALSLDYAQTWCSVSEFTILSEVFL